MTQDVRVRRCELTVRGRGGWGWGDDPRRYVEAALPAVEAALARVLVEADLPDEVDLHLTEPVRLRWRPDRTLDDEVRHVLVAALRAAVPAPTDAAVAAQPPDGEAPEPPEAGPDPGAPVVPAERLRRLLVLLAAWSRTGRLPVILAGWPEETVRRWAAAVGGAGAVADDVVEMTDDAVAAVAGALLVPTATSKGSAGREADRVLLVLAALVAAAGDRPLGTRTVRQARLIAGATLPAKVEPPLVGTVPRGSVTAEEWRATNERAGARVTPYVLRRGTVPGLPFLVLVQLARIGYLDALWAVAATAGPDPDLVGRALVGGLAGKVLPPPRRGWSREPDETAAVLDAAGTDGVTWDHAAYAVRGAAEVLEPPLRSALVAAYAEVGQVEVTETAAGYVVGEARAALPVAWVGSPEEVTTVLHQLGDPPSTRSDRFAPLVAALAPRRAFPGADLPALERHLGAAVGAALGSLGVELWGADVGDAPALALDRLADLEVELRPSDSARDPAIAVAVPRGQRWLDLRAAGLLDRWPVPWDSRGWELVTW